MRRKHRSHTPNSSNNNNNKNLFPEDRVCRYPEELGKKSKQFCCDFDLMETKNESARATRLSMAMQQLKKQTTKFFESVFFSFLFFFCASCLCCCWHLATCMHVYIPERKAEKKSDRTLIYYYFSCLSTLIQISL